MYFIFDDDSNSIFPINILIDDTGDQFYTLNYSKMATLKKKTKIGFQDRLSLNAGQKFCRMSILQYFDLN